MTSVAALQTLAHTGAHVIDYSLMADNHHGPAIEAMLRDVLQEGYDRSTTEGNRVARKPVVQPVGVLYLPPRQALVLSTIQEFKWYGMGSGSYQVNATLATSRPSGSAIFAIGRNEHDAGVVLDGLRNGKFLGVSVVQRPEDRARPETCNRDALIVCKSNPAHTSTPCHDVELDVEVTGWWRGAGVRLGSPVWNPAQEDHITGAVRVYGQYDPVSPDQTDYWNTGVDAGNRTWANNRRHRLTWLKALGVRTALRAEKTGIQVDWLTCDAVRLVVAVAGTVGKVVIQGGESELAQFLFSDHQGFPHDHGITIRDFYAKLDAWRPGLGSSWHGVGDPRPDHNELGNWWSGGTVQLDNVSVKGPEVRRNASGKLMVVTNVVTHEDGTEDVEWTETPAPRFRIMNGARLLTSNLRVFGYRTPQEAFTVMEGSEARHRMWTRSLPDGRRLPTPVDDILQRAGSAA